MDMPSFFLPTITDRLIQYIPSKVLQHIYSRSNLKMGVKDTLNGLYRRRVYTLDTLLNVFPVILYIEFEKKIVC